MYWHQQRASLANNAQPVSSVVDKRLSRCNGNNRGQNPFTKKRTIVGKDTGGSNVAAVKQLRKKAVFA